MFDRSLLHHLFRDDINAAMELRMEGDRQIARETGAGLRRLGLAVKRWLAAAARGLDNHRHLPPI